MTVSYCPVCEDRTVHVRVRSADGVGVRERCYEHTDVSDGLETGEYELVA